MGRGLRGAVPAALAAAGIGVLSAAAFAPSLGGDFLPWDDEKNFLHNTAYRGLGPRQLAWMWTHALTGHYVPVTWMTLGLDHAVWGMEPLGYRLTSLAIHAANGFLLAMLLVRILPPPVPGTPEPGPRAATVWAGAGLTAAWYAVHPMRAESVCWVTERRDVLSGLFVLLSVHAYVSWCSGPVRRGRAPWWSLLLFAMALLSKGLAVALPLALVALDAAALGRLSPRPWAWPRDAGRRVLGEKVPFVAVAVLSAMVTLAAARHAMPPLRDMGASSRIAAAAFGHSFQIEKLLWPADLPIIEPVEGRPSLGEPRFGIRLAALVCLAAGAVAAGRRHPAIPWALAVHAAFLLPVSGLLQAGPQLAAVRYGYLAAMPLHLLAGAALATGLARFSPRLRAVAWGAMAAASLSLLVPLARAEARAWRDGHALWSTAVLRRPRAAVARHGLALVHQRAGRPREAMSELAAGLAAHPSHPDLLTLAALLRAASPDDAVRDPAEGLRLARAAVARTESPWARWTLAVALASAGDVDGSLAEAERALAGARAQQIPALEAQLARTLPELREGRPYRLSGR